MHSSLTVKNHVIVLAVSAAIAAAVLLLSNPPPRIPSLVGAGSGVVVGLLQALSASATPPAFRRAANGADIRDALKASRAGRASIILHWTAALATIGAAIWIGKPLVGTLGGWAMYEVTRRLASLRAIVMLNRSETAPKSQPPKREVS